jgi:hypothetical protein
MPRLVILARGGFRQPTARHHHRRLRNRCATHPWPQPGLYVFRNKRSADNRRGQRQHESGPARDDLGGLGYRVVDFPYVQPAISAEQRAVHTLRLLAKSMSTVPLDAMCAQTAKSLVRDYLVLAMRISQPEADADYQAMAAALDSREMVSLIALTTRRGYDGRRDAGLRSYQMKRGDEAELQPNLSSCTNANPRTRACKVVGTGGRLA